MADTPANIVIRNAKVEYGATAGLGLEIGYVKDVKLKISPAVTETDSQGIPIVPGYAVEGQFRMMENNAARMSALLGLLDGTEYYVKFTDRNDSDRSVIFPKVNFYLDSELDLNGKADGFLVKFSYYTNPNGLVDMIPV
jgi:hypothetical protein